MTEKIIIGGTPVLLSAGAGALIYYKKQFGSEYTDDHGELSEMPPEQRYIKLAEIKMKLLWSMARAADKVIQPFADWVLQFTAADLALASQAAEELFTASLKYDGEHGQQTGREFTSESLIASALACGLSVDDLDDMPLPMVLETIGEWCRIKGYAEEEARPATQEDFDAL